MGIVAVVTLILHVITLTSTEVLSTLKLSTREKLAEMKTYLKRQAKLLSAELSAATRAAGSD